MIDVEGMEKLVAQTTEAYEIALRRYRNAVKKVALRMFDDNVPDGGEQQRLRGTMFEYERASAVHSATIFAAIHMIEHDRLNVIMKEAKTLASYAHDTEV